MNHGRREGKYGPIFTVAQGITVMQTRYGTWQLCLCQKGVRNRKNYEAGDKGLQKAIRKAEALARRLGLTVKADEPKNITLSRVADSWLESNRARWTWGTYERYSQQVRDRIAPALGALPIQEVTRMHVKDFLAGLLDDKSPKTVELLHAILSGIFQEGIDRGLIRENPASRLLSRLLPPKHKRNQSSPDPFSKDDLDLFLETAYRHLPDPLPLILETLAYTGMRLGECLAMHVDHLDLLNAKYMVSKTVKRGRFGLPKTGKRLINLPNDPPNDIAGKLGHHITRLREAAMARGGSVGYLFPGINDRHVQRAMTRVCALAKLRRRHPHDLRHTYATILLMEHVSPFYVQRQLGHHSIRMTCDTYGAWFPEEGMERANQALNRRSEPKKAARPRLTVVK